MPHIRIEAAREFSFPFVFRFAFLFFFLVSSMHCHIFRIFHHFFIGLTSTFVIGVELGFELNCYILVDPLVWTISFLDSDRYVWLIMYLTVMYLIDLVCDGIL